MSDGTISTLAVVVSFIAISWNVVLGILSARQRRAGAQANEADAIESLTASVNSLHSKVQELESKLDTERVARRAAEAALADLTRRFVILERDNKLLVFENAALKDALDEVTSDLS